MRRPDRALESDWLLRSYAWLVIVGTRAWKLGTAFIGLYRKLEDLFLLWASALGLLMEYFGASLPSMGGGV